MRSRALKFLKVRGDHRLGNFENNILGGGVFQRAVEGLRQDRMHIEIERTRQPVARDKGQRAQHQLIEHMGEVLECACSAPHFNTGEERLPQEIDADIKLAHRRHQGLRIAAHKDGLMAHEFADKILRPHFLERLGDAADVFIAKPTRA